MTAASAPVLTRPVRARRRPGLSTARLLWLALRHNAMPWLLPVAVAVFWLTSFRKTVAMPPLWNVRAAGLQVGVVTSFIVPVVGAAAWMGSEEARRRLTDQVVISAKPRWARLLVTWAATTIWALAGYLVCLAAVYGVTARDASWGGPLWWPAAIAAASLPLYCALGFAAGALLPGRLTAPAAAVLSFFVLVFSTEPIHGSHSYWQISPVVAGPWDLGPNSGVAAFYPFLPDLSIAQLMFLTGLAVAVLGALALPGSVRSGRAGAAIIAAAGLLAAGTGVVLAGTGRLNEHGMIAIPALHDAASDRPLRFTPVCTGTAIPVCLNPLNAGDLPAVAAALSPVLTEIAGLPGAPVRVSQGAPVYQQEPGNAVAVGLSGLQMGGNVYRLVLPDQLPGSPLTTTTQLAEQVRATSGPAIIASFVGGDPGASQAQQAVAAALSMAAGLPTGTISTGRPIPRGTSRPELQPQISAAAHRFAALPLAARRAWLARNLTALRAGQITLAQLP
jgi:hypothetical protein